MRQQITRQAFADRYAELHAPMHADFDAFVQQRGAPALPAGQFMHESPHLNLYLYPDAVDYPRASPLSPTWHNLGACVRRADADWRPPAALGDDAKLIYLSLGSLGSADTELMQRFIDVLGRTRHRVIVSMGPQHSELRLADNMWGGEVVPQPAILPQVDLVITHGGNNTVTECLYFGKPMVLHPLFWDQHDNAQRIHETGLGRRIPAYAFGDAELLHAINQLLEDRDAADRLSAISAELRARPGTAAAAERILEVAASP